MIVHDYTNYKYECSGTWLEIIAGFTMCQRITEKVHLWSFCS